MSGSMNKKFNPETYHLGQIGFYKIPTVGDGNCAFNALALGLIDLIHKGQLNQKTQETSRFLDHILITLNETVSAHSSEDEDLVGKLHDVNALQEVARLKDWPSFCNWVKQETEVGHLEKTLAKALRSIAKTLPYLEVGQEGIYESNIEVERVAADIFNVFPNTYTINRSQAGALDLFSNTENPEGPTISILHHAEHFSYLAPQVDGGIGHFRKLFVQESSADELTQRLGTMRDKLGLKDMSSDHLKDMLQRMLPGASKGYISHAAELVLNWTPEKYTQSGNNDHSVDAMMAIQMQHDEVMGFFQRHGKAIQDYVSPRSAKFCRSEVIEPALTTVQPVTEVH